MPVLLRTRHLQIFLAVARAGSMQRAAKDAHLSQPAISKLIGELEGILGATLFARSRRGVTLTESGLALSVRADAILNDLDNTQDEIAAIERGALGRVRVGVLPVAEGTILPAALLALRRSAPGLAIQLEEGTRSLLLTSLRRGEIDCVIGRLDAGPPPKDLRVEKLVLLPVAIVASAAHPLAKAKRLSWRDLAAYPWILPGPGAPIRKAIDGEFANAGVTPPEPIIESTSMRLNHAVLRGTDMIGVMTKDAAAAYARSGDLAILPVAMTAALPHVGVITRGQSTSRALAAFLDALRAPVSRSDQS